MGEYGKFISKHGGSNNAGTGQEHTSYFFSIDNAQLEPALDRFSRFFVDPLSDPEFVEKERNAVESEYSLKVKEYVRRYREAVKQTVNKDHPMSQFSVGNLETLSDTDESTILDDVKAHYKTLHSDLIYERYNFDNRAQLTAAVKALSADDIAAFYKEDILSHNRRSMTMWSIGKAHVGEESYNASAYDICKADKCIYGKSISN